jgi:hypothetical protein
MITFIVIFSIGMSLVLMVIIPSSRTGPFGIGLPASTRIFNSKESKFSIMYPRSWVPFDLPQGNHGDQEVTTSILVPGRSFPQVFVAKKNFITEDNRQVAMWGETRKMPLMDYKILSMDNIRTASFDGLLRKYSYKNSSLFKELNIICYDFYVMDKLEGYALSFCSEEKDWPLTEPVFIQMIQSFSIK